MRFEGKSAQATGFETDLALVAVYEKGAMSAAAKALDKAADGLISEVTKRGEIKG